MMFALLARYADEIKAGTLDVVILFANTGNEHEKTLEFVHKCAEKVKTDFGMDVIWIEAVVHDGRNGTTCKAVTYESASKDGEPFKSVIAKYGIPNAAYPHCTRETKLQPMTAYLRSIGWESGSYKTAIGIRADEADRMNSNAKKLGFVYPLVKMGVRKCDVLAWWKQQPFDLEIPEHYGNCVTCWKKTDRKLYTIAQDDATAFEWNAEMENKYGLSGSNKTGEPRVFFRKNRSTEQILEAARNFPRSERFVEGMYSTNELDLGSACGETCEIGADV